MIYAALAAVLVAGLCWDFGRRWLVMRERAEEAALIRISEHQNEWLDKLGDVQSTMNLRVRELSDRIQNIQGQMDAAANELRGAADDIEASDARINERIRSIEVSLERDIGHISGKIIQLEQRPAESADVTKFTKALENLVRETREELGKRATREELESEIKKVRSVQAGMVAGGRTLRG